MAKRSSTAVSRSARSFELCRVISTWLRFRCPIHQADRPDQPKSPSADTREHPLGRPRHHSPACRVRLRGNPDKREPDRAVFHYVKIYPVCGDDVTFHRERSFCALLEFARACPLQRFSLSLLCWKRNSSRKESIGFLNEPPHKFRSVRTTAKTFALSRPYSH